MEKEEFIEQYREDTNKMSAMDIVYGELVEYCRANDIDEDDISTDELTEAARMLISGEV